MIRHLILASGYELTECRLTEVPYGEELTNFPESMTCPACRRALIGQGKCPACEGGPLEWSAGPVKLNSVVDGRLTMRDVETQFYLGCTECSETLIHSVSADQVAAFLTSERWLP
jgi:hypothetical protein